jgi:hypothetical protein
LISVVQTSSGPSPGGCGTCRALRTGSIGSSIGADQRGDRYRIVVLLGDRSIFEIEDQSVRDGSLADSCKIGSANIRCAAHTPSAAPTNCTAIWARAERTVISRRTRNARVTAGLNCAPEIGPNIEISTTKAAPLVVVTFARVRGAVSCQLRAGGGRAWPWILGAPSARRHGEACWHAGYGTT